MSLAPESCDLHIEADGSLSVVAREGRHVVAGYSADGYWRDGYSERPLAQVARREIEKWLVWARRSARKRRPQ